MHSGSPYPAPPVISAVGTESPEELARLAAEEQVLDTDRRGGEEEGGSAAETCEGGEGGSWGREE